MGPLTGQDCLEFWVGQCRRWCSICAARILPICAELSGPRAGCSTQGAFGFLGRATTSPLLASDHRLAIAASSIPPFDSSSGRVGMRMPVLETLKLSILLNSSDPKVTLGEGIDNRLSLHKPGIISSNRIKCSTTSEADHAPGMVTADRCDNGITVSLSTATRFNSSALANQSNSLNSGPSGLPAVFMGVIIYRRWKISYFNHLSGDNPRIRHTFKKLHIKKDERYTVRHRKPVRPLRDRVRVPDDGHGHPRVARFGPPPRTAATIDAR
jgi:hypothetical protein